ncbi:transcription factor bHLH106-like [Aristolochia californica]|uniref:transcription factor bHLH106-like n=1 Tax=Aristolochia californica TaxID=171875 RepID=UPI0035D635E8
MQPGTSQGTSELYRLLAQSMMGFAGQCGTPVNYGAPAESSVGGNFFPLEMAGITELRQGRDLEASKHQHKEAEKQRRKRINSHLDKLRTLLPCNSKTDKASLLAKVVQHVKDLKQQTSEITELDLFPSESDEIAVFSCEPAGGDGRSVLKASLCCEDRSDLLPDLIETIRSLRLKTLRAEMATMGGRVRNVLLLGAGDDDELSSDDSAAFLRDALRSIVEKQSSGDRGKRRRIFDRKMG